MPATSRRVRQTVGYRNVFEHCERQGDIVITIRNRYGLSTEWLNQDLMDLRIKRNWRIDGG